MLDVAVTLVYLVRTGTATLLYLFRRGTVSFRQVWRTLLYKDHHLLRLESGLLDIAMMRRPWVVGVEVTGEGRHGRTAAVVPVEWWGVPGRRHAVRTVIKAMMAQLRPPVLLVLACSHGHAASRVPCFLVLRPLIETAFAQATPSRPNTAAGTSQ